MIGRILKFGLYIGAFLIISAASAYITLTYFIHSEADVVVPDLTGKHVVVALELLSDLSLNTKIKGMEYSAKVPRYHVIDQDPAPGTEIKPGRDVRIIVSKGQETVAVPALDGLSLSQAQIVLEENGLKVGNTSRVYQNQTAVDVVMSQVPSSGRIIHRDTSVDLLVSLGDRPSDFMMPDLTGLSLDEAVPLLKRGSLSLGKVSTVSVKTLPVNRIVDQSPPAGYRVFVKDMVDLTINRPTDASGKPFTVPTGLTLLRHRVAPGFLNSHIQVRLNAFGMATDLIDTFVKPGHEVWCFIPPDTDTTAFLYVDGQLVRSEVIE